MGAGGGPAGLAWAPPWPPSLEREVPLEREGAAGCGCIYAGPCVGDGEGGGLGGNGGACLMGRGARSDSGVGADASQTRIDDSDR